MLIFNEHTRLQIICNRTTEAPSVMINAPIFGEPAGRLTAMFQAGDTAGDYILTFALNNGNMLQLFVTVE
jgi:hypothetical protein